MNGHSENHDLPRVTVRQIGYYIKFVAWRFVINVIYLEISYRQMLFVINIPSVIVMLYRTTYSYLMGLDNEIEQYHWTQYKT